MATHGRTGLTGFLLGSVTAGVVRHALMPVMVVPPLVRIPQPRTVAEPARARLQLAVTH
jgi:hypothetical protein